MSEEIAISVNTVSKDFLLAQRANSIKSIFTGITSGQKKKPAELQHALKDISFEVKKGEFFGIVGRNGSGKSTMLKILAGIYQPTKGSVHTNGRLVPFIELGVGFNPELTGRENVYLNGAMLGFSEKQVSKMYKDIVEFAELEKFMDQKLKNYSSGMQVRLAFSMATRAKADILLVDEVLAVGDADFQRKCFEYFKSLKKNKKTVVFVSHDMSAIREYCDRVVLIENSRMVLEGDPEKVAAGYTRMFNNGDHVPLSNKEDDDDEDNRWGNRKAVIKKVTVTPSKVTTKDNEVNIAAEIVADVDLNNLVVGFAIKDATGKGIAGTNTRLEKVNTGQWHSKKPKTIQWTLPNIFSDGGYTVDIAVLQDDAQTVCEWWDGAQNFTSFQDIPLPYLVSPPIATVVKEA